MWPYLTLYKVNMRNRTFSFNNTQNILHLEQMQCIYMACKHFVQNSQKEPKM